MVEIIQGNLQLIKSYHQCIEEIAKEKKYIARIHPIPFENFKNWQISIIEKDYPQYFAINDDEVIGFCNIFPKQTDAMHHVGELAMALLAAYRNQGIGTELLNNTIKNAKNQNLEKIQLEVFESNINAVKFYKKHHFIQEGLLTKGRKLDGKYDNILLMARFI